MSSQTPRAAAAPAAPLAAAAVTGCWATDDDYRFSTNTPVNTATAMVGDSNNMYLVAGSVGTASDTQWIVRGRKSNSTSWSVLDTFVHTAGVRNQPTGIATTGQGDIVVVGGATAVGSNNGSWLTRRTTNNGNTWTTVDVFGGTPPAGSAAGVIGDPLMVTGGQTDPANPANYRWYTRTSTNGTTWTTSDDVGPDLVGRALTSDSAGNVYTTGIRWDGRQYRWVVRKRTAATGVWSQVDEFVASPLNDGDSYGAQPSGIFADGLTIYVVGTYLPPPVGSQAHWLVRQSINGGATWTTVDDVAIGGFSCSARAGVKSASALYVSGRCHDGTSYRWLIRRSTNLGSTWITDDEYQLVADRDAAGNAMTVAKDGTVFSVGTARESDNTSHWIVRRRTCGN